MLQSRLYFTTFFLSAKSVVCVGDFRDRAGDSGRSTCGTKGSGPEIPASELAGFSQTRGRPQTLIAPRVASLYQPAGSGSVRRLCRVTRGHPLRPLCRVTRGHLPVSLPRRGYTGLRQPRGVPWAQQKLGLGETVEKSVAHKQTRPSRVPCLPENRLGPPSCPAAP